MLKITPTRDKEKPITVEPKSIIASLTGPISDSLAFQWNVEGFASNAISFSYYIGEGPLYWYRVDWLPAPCENILINIPPSISYERGFPSCPVEITDTCEYISPCFCPCPPTCVMQNREVWHMLATSVTHLCFRINNECCHRKPPGMMYRVQKYSRPALCCDVENADWQSWPSTIDDWEDVPFIDVCECGNLINTCLIRVIYPWHINNCGIHGPQYPGPPLPDPPAGSGSIPPPAFAPLVQMPVKEMKTNRIHGKFGYSISEVIKCSHNLNECSGLHLDTTNVNMYYDSRQGIWRGKQDAEDTRILFEFGVTEFGYKFNVDLDKQKKKSRVSINVKGSSFEDKLLKINFNTRTGVLKSKGVLQSKMVQDEAGVFRAPWENILEIKLGG